MRNVVRFLFHLTPVIFIFLKLKFATFAAIFLVILAYIKFFKLQQAVDFHSDNDKVRLQYQRAMYFWKYFCFINEK